MPKRLVIYASQALLPDNDEPQAATIDVDLESGKIAKVSKGVTNSPPMPTANVDTFKAEDGQVLIPGLVE